MKMDEARAEKDAGRLGGLLESKEKKTQCNSIAFLKVLVSVLLALTLRESEETKQARHKKESSDGERSTSSKVALLHLDQLCIVHRRSVRPGRKEGGRTDRKEKQVGGWMMTGRLCQRCSG